jgi:hypothetical protein
VGKNQTVKKLRAELETVKFKHEALFLRIAAQSAVQCSGICESRGDAGEKFNNPDECGNKDCFVYGIWESLKKHGSLK